MFIVIMRLLSLGTTVGRFPQLLEVKARIITAGYEAVSLVLKTIKYIL